MRYYFCADENFLKSGDKVRIIKRSVDDGKITEEILEELILDEPHYDKDLKLWAISSKRFKHMQELFAVLNDSFLILQKVANH